VHTDEEKGGAVAELRAGRAARCGGGGATASPVGGLLPAVAAVWWDGGGTASAASGRWMVGGDGRGGAGRCGGSRGVTGSREESDSGTRGKRPIRVAVVTRKKRVTLCR
jgi:hypothetical protein